jgi:hypothetical protein
MLRTFVLAAVIAAATVWTQPASADWQYTKWGMQPEQAMRASAGQLRPPTAAEAPGMSIRGEPPGLVGSYAAGTMVFTVGLYFRGPGQTLDLVQLVLQNRDRFQEVVPALRGQYGEPVARDSTTVGQVYRWRDDRNNLSVQLYAFDNRAVISYTSLRGAAGGRL